MDDEIDLRIKLETADVKVTAVGDGGGDGSVGKTEQVSANGAGDQAGQGSLRLNALPEETELQVKAEFLIKDCPRTLCAEFLSEEDKARVENSQAAEAVKLSGQNKKRPGPTKYSNADRICPSLVDVGVDEEPKPCPRSSGCDYKHDIAAVMAERKPDIVEGGCYVYRTLGRCPRGVACLMGAEHLTPSGRNLQHPNPSDPAVSTYSNFLAKDFQWELRKKKYNLSQSMKMVEQVKQDKRKTEPTSPKKMRTMEGPILDGDGIRLRASEKKKIEWRGKLYLAPLTTVGNLPFRRLCKKLGADVTCGEMAMADTIIEGGQHEWALVRRHSSEDLFGVQICGSNPYSLTKCAQILQDKTDVDFVDLNLGCPIDGVYQKGAGSGLMQRQGPLEVSIQSMARLLQVPLTVKMRTGVCSNRPLAHTLVTQCRDWGVSMVTIHGRSREQRYTKSADWSYIGQCVRAATPGMAVYGNGDVFSFEDYEQDVADSGVDGIMIARGALIKPWIFTEIKERKHWDISSRERFDYLKDFANFGLEHWGSDAQGVERTRRFLLEWQSFAHRYVPVGLLERPPQKMNLRPPLYHGRDDLETLLASPNCRDWLRVCEMLLGPAPDDFLFLPKHKANSWK